LLDKKKGKLFFTFFLARKQKCSGKKFFLFFSGMNFCFLKRLFYTVQEETMSVAQPHLGKPESLLIGSRKSSPAVDGATAAQTLGQCNKPIERPITSVSALYDARQAS
jgi:hypothetical protein